MSPKRARKSNILLLVFIHGFKGGDETFEGFPKHLNTLLRNALPDYSILSLTYPRYDTRGDLTACVASFKEWLQNKVIDLEVANGTPSPTVDPCVRTILIGHSMGGIVAAETVLSILAERPIPHRTQSESVNNATASAATDSKPASRTGSPHPKLSRPSSPRRTASSRPDMPRRQSSNIASQSPTRPAKSTPTPNVPASSGADSPAFMFPYIQAVLAFDTPYLGVAPGVVAYGAEGQWNTITSAYSAYNTVAGMFGMKAAGSSGEGAAGSLDASRALPAAPGSSAAGAAVADPSGDAAATPLWQRWGKYAMFAGAAGAVAAGGAAAYLKKDQISSSVGEGWSWATSHLEFVGCLARGEELSKRLSKICKATEERNLGFTNFYTALGSNASDRWYGVATGVGNEEKKVTVPGDQRTFCIVPRKEEWKSHFIRCTNEKADSEIHAHTSMFSPRENPGYSALAEGAKNKIIAWVT